MMLKANTLNPILAEILWGIPREGFVLFVAQSEQGNEGIRQRMQEYAEAERASEEALYQVHLDPTLRRQVRAFDRFSVIFALRI